MCLFKKVRSFSEESECLPRKAQAALVFELKKEGFKLKDVLKKVAIPEATYHYHIKKFQKEDPDKEWKEKIKELYKKHGGKYGCRRISLKLRGKGNVINHKKVQRIMSELGLKCEKFTRKSRYKSYKGKVGKVAKKSLNRRFHTTIPLQKLVTDVTEFRCAGDKKLYLSPIMDLFNGEVISFGISNSPTLDFVLEPLGEALKVIGNEAKYRTTIHSDQGWHYQHNKWVQTLKKNKVFQSMSRKAACADNAAMENFFGILKQEMYYGEELVSYEELKSETEEYIYYYNNERIKEKLTGLSPVQFQTQTSQSAV
ncbi:Transposase InsO and inactivated derivatives [Halobacillus dabanensis]|uniref:Transposase InsO and inactivated derivatives n=1 Tax=Halobacillus dabanensis TaxID=240302 RepID=A0A1I3T5V2_HALDA|nr:Transposase InsO and inactivated derivatives [Halobacillus dabanensis]